MKPFAHKSSFRHRVSGVLAGLLMTTFVGCEFFEADPATSGQTSTKGPPAVKHKLVVEGGNTFDFGATEVGQEFEHVFLIKNTGDSDATVEKGPPSCVTCTSFEIDTHRIEPGKTMKATVKWRIKAENPVFSQFAPLMVNQGEEVRLYVTGKVVKRIILSPTNTWNVGDVFEGQPKEFVATVTSAVLDKFDVASITNRDKNLKVTATPLNPEKLKQLKVKSGFELKAVLQPAIDIGDFKDTVVITVLDPKSIPLNVDVVARRSGPMQIFGPNWNEEQLTLGLGSFDPRQELVTRLNLSTRGVSGDLQFVKVSSKDPRVTAELKPDLRFKNQQAGDYKRYELVVKVAASNQPVVYSRQEPLMLQIETNQPLVGTINLKIRCQATIP